MQNSRARLLRDKTPNPSLADVKARQSSKIREIGEAFDNCRILFRSMHRQRHSDCQL